MAGRSITKPPGAGPEAPTVAPSRPPTAPAETKRTAVDLLEPADVYFCLPIQDQQVHQALQAAGCNLPPRSPDKYHLTLHYLKGVPDPEQQRLMEIGRAVCRKNPTFDLILDQPGSFEIENNPPEPEELPPRRVFWYGVKSTGGLHQLRTDIGRAILDLGYQADYGYNPHITLGRARPPLTVPTVDPVRWRVDQVELRKAGPNLPVNLRLAKFLLAEMPQLYPHNPNSIFSGD